MSSSDHDQTSLQRYGRTVRRAYGEFNLSAGQRQLHHTLLDEVARRRATGRLRSHLAEAAAIAAIALLVIIALVTWQAIQPENDESTGAPPASADPTATNEPSAMAETGPALADHINYMFRDGDVVGIDPDTGEEVQHIDVNTGTPSPFLAVSYESGRIAVGDLLRLQNGGDQLGSSADTEYGIKVYRMSDGSLEQQIPAAGLVTCREECEGVIFSRDGQRLHVYQRDWPGGADASSIRYMLTTYDLEAREWLEDVDLGNCGPVHNWGFVDNEILWFDCTERGSIEVNTSTSIVVTDRCGPVETPSTNSTCYMFRDGDVVGIDRMTGDVVQQIDVNIGSQSPFLAVSYETGRIAVGDFLRREDGVELGVKIYRMSDGSLQQEIPVPTMMRCLSRCEGLIFSQDGQRLHIYQYEIPPEANGNGNLADYWLGTFDLDSREWMQDVDMGSCGVVFDFSFIDDKMLKADCGLEIDTATFTLR